MHAHATPGSLRAATTIVFADCSGGTPYRAQNAAVSAKSGSQASVLVLDAERREPVSDLRLDRGGVVSQHRVRMADP